MAVLCGLSTAANAATPAVSVTGAGATSPVLRQTGAAWQTTVLVTDSGADTGCVQGTAVQYWLATRPYGVIMQPGVPGKPGTVGVHGRHADGTYDWQGSRYHLFRRAWWKQPISGSGAWSSGDSWATNITTGLVVVTTCLAATTASSTMMVKETP